MASVEISGLLEAWRNLDTPLHLDEAAPHGSPPPRTTEEWLIPGRKWKGAIAIPGHEAGREPVPYRFEIAHGSQTQMQNSIYCIHADEVDGQAAVVHFVGVNAQGHTRMRWQDLETAIEATIDPLTGVITGRVFQIRETLGEGFWYDSDQELNCCYLEPLKENSQYHVDFRRKIQDITQSKEYIEASLDQPWPLTSPCTVEEMHLLFEEACLQSQLLQADMLEQINKLRQTTFTTVAEKRKQVCQVGCGEKSVRHRSHIATDKCSALLRRSLIYMSVVVQGEATPDEVLYKAHHNCRLHESRMRKVYETLDTALRQFEQRVPEEVLHRHKYHFDAVPSDAACCICLDRAPPQGPHRPCNLGYSGPPIIDDVVIDGADDTAATNANGTCPPASNGDAGARASPTDVSGSTTHGKEEADGDRNCRAQVEECAPLLSEAAAGGEIFGSVESPENTIDEGASLPGGARDRSSFYTAPDESLVVEGQGHDREHSCASTNQSTSRLPHDETMPSIIHHHHHDASPPVGAGAGDAAGIPITRETEEGQNNEWIILPCSHTFHLRCAWEWFHHSNECPYCRTVVKECRCGEVVAGAATGKDKLDEIN